MKKKFKRSLIGYSPASLEVFLKSTNEDFKSKLEDLRKQLADEVHHLELLKLQVQNVKDERSSYESLKNKIIQMLFDAHFVAAEKIYIALRDAEQVEKKAVDKVLIKKRELDKLKTDMENMRGEIRLIATQYESILEKAEGGLPYAQNSQ